VAWEERSRSELVVYLRELLSGRHKAEASHYTWSSIVNLACGLEAWELRPQMDAVFARGLLDEFDVDASHVADAHAGKFGSLWDDFVEMHAPIRDVAEATDFLDKPFEEDEEDSEPMPEKPPAPIPSATGSLTTGAITEPEPRPFTAPPKVGRNEPCPCGSGKKYKKCCGR